MKKIIDCATGEITEREWTAEELAQAEKDAVELAEIHRQNEIQQQIKNAAKAELLGRLGITEDEAKLLLGGN